MDPPRAGLDEATCRHVKRYPWILYVSCGPDALKRDLKRLGRTHAVVKAALFDHFPRTPHLETAVLLRATESWVRPG